MIKCYGIAAELYEDSLLTFVQKIALFIQKLLKENEAQFHMAIS